jgi:hypothetical protein
LPPDELLQSLEALDFDMPPLIDVLAAENPVVELRCEICLAREWACEQLLSLARSCAGTTVCANCSVLYAVVLANQIVPVTEVSVTVT